MAPRADRQRFRNEDLVLAISSAVDRRRWDDTRYEAFLEALCQEREYQKEAIRTALRFLLGGRYTSLSQLARENFDLNESIQQRSGSWEGMLSHLQFPEQLAASLDLATGTGKSYVLYGLAMILLAEDIVDRVLVLCPSTTIETGLLEKFRSLAANSDIRDALPAHSKWRVPSVTNGSGSLVEGSICVENYHSILTGSRSSIRESLLGKGDRIIVLNDETHHVANEPEANAKKWKNFLLDPDFGFKYIIGVSGTCYVDNDYFFDVIYRYSLREAMEQRYVKKVDYIADLSGTPKIDEKWQLIQSRHLDITKRIASHGIRPLTIVITPTVASCRETAADLKQFLIEHGGLTPEDADTQVLTVYSGAKDLPRLASVDSPGSEVQWIVSVSMLNEGWDVKRVFQIVPHEERAFNSKLLIAQVLGRGLRIPNGWQEQPTVTVFNHDAWAVRIRSLVMEVLELEKRLSTRVNALSEFNFDLHNIDYTLIPTSVKKPMLGEYNILAKGYVDLATESASEDVNVTFERASTGVQYQWSTQIRRNTFTSREVAEVMYERLEQAQDPEDPDPKMRTVYTDKMPVERLQELVDASLARLGTTLATESMRQKCLQALGPLRRKVSENVRYQLDPNDIEVVSTANRPSDSASAVELRTSKTLLYTEDYGSQLGDLQLDFFREVSEPGSIYKQIKVSNPFDFKTPSPAVIADHENEKRFINSHLLRAENLTHYDAWIKSTSTRFYEIDFAWKKGEHPKRGKFSPDFFIKMGVLIIVVEIKGNEELRDPSDENKKKNEFAQAHFERLNTRLAKEGIGSRYKFCFLTESGFNKFFQAIREGTVEHFRSELDVILAADTGSS